MGRGANVFLAEIIGWLKNTVIEFLGAIKDHRSWINSDRARALANTFEISGRLLSYAAYIAFAWLAFNSFIGIRDGLSKGVYVVAEQIGGSRVALLNILAAGLIGPMAMIAIGFGIGWIYNLAVAAANRTLPRFAQPLIHPLLMFAVVAAFAAAHSSITATVASGYLHAKANIEAASPPSTVSIKAKVIDIPGLGGLKDDDSADRDSTRDRELVQLKSMFTNRQPCVQASQGTDLDPQSEVVQPEPGFAPAGDCQVEKKIQLE
jgi:hypothetical protein